MTAPDPRLGEIAARLAKVPAKGESAFISAMLPIHATTELWNLRQLAREDIPYLLAALADRDAKLARVEALAAALDHTEHGGNAERSDTCWACQRQNYGARSPWPCIYHNHSQRIRAAVADTTGGENK